jgi:Ribosomal protein L10
LSLGAKILPASDLDMIASLPTKDQAIAIFMLTLVAPVTKLARTTAETYTKVVRAIAAVGEQGKAT